ncbi:hypothetical protein BCR37DRAFT_6376 [Protomyces lactucae-debilis]|uniref:BRCT domain-containing protein n=1 Tax=Protomyces lactucae-debilis TaxID=2754530 RepID=A0A1Y2FYF8_PROLT|nr:uncharacterized protein BCR37DRAFT_6376 [Protomyces lactucae-debilis]ORY87715.1 hypothetical protein BCR37DRAFT_6376 [Protomyces lactucae-debilis]
MSEKPLSHVVLCCTAVPAHQRVSITRQAHDMGATLQGALTSDVTHLVVGSSQSDKYRFAARSRTDIQLMGIDWVAQLHERWISGQDVDVGRLEKLYRHKIFTGLRISVTNLDADERSEVESLVQQHGGQYTGDLTKENTHLIAGFASGRKFDAVAVWNNGIKVVGIEWLHVSIQRGAALGEEYFSLTIPSKERGKDAWQPPAKPVVMEASSDLSSGLKRKADVTAPAVALKRKLSKRTSQHAGNSDGLWDQIFINGPADQPSQPGEQDVTFDLPDTTTHFIGDAEGGLDDAPSLPIFRGLKFAISGFDERQKRLVKAALEGEQGEIIDNVQPGCYVVVPQGQTPPMQVDATTLVTEWWIERCLHFRRTVDPSQSLGCQPYASQFPVAEMNKMSICTTGFEGIELLHTEKLIKLVGARFTETLTRDCSILIAKSPSSRRCNAAPKLGVRVVSLAWLEAIATCGQSTGIVQYALDGIENSRCRLDGVVVRQQNRRKALRGCKVYICPDCQDHKLLIFLTLELGAELVKSYLDTITHLVGELEQLAKQESILDDGDAIAVTPAWLRACDAASSRVAESGFRPGKTSPAKPSVKAEPTKSKPTAKLEKKATATSSVDSALNLTAKMIPSGSGKRSRRLLGRAASAPDAFIEDGALSDVSIPGAGLSLRTRLASLPTAVREDAYAFDTAKAQLVPQEKEEEEGEVRYADPETAAVRRSILARLEGRANEAGDVTLVRQASSLSTDHVGSLKGGASVASLLREESTSVTSHAGESRASSGSGMTKAVGLGSRKTRGRTAAVAAKVAGLNGRS